jgi:hypothetical protein
LERERLLRRLDVGPDGRFIAEARDWGDYWEPVAALGHAEMTGRLEQLHDVWGRYIRAGLDHSLRREYCFRYFALVDSALAEHLAGPASATMKSALQRVLGFECFGIPAAGCAEEPVAAATSMLDMELVDVGSGSGILSARLCQQVRRFLASRGIASRFRVWMVDLTLRDPSRFFGGRQLRSSIDCVAVVGSDYRRWLSAKDRLPRAGGIRIALVSRFFNNLSDFSVTTAPVGELADSVGWRGLDADWRGCLPTQCLGPDSRGPEALDVSNSRIWLEQGRGFAQASLSPYFEGLYHVTATGKVGIRERHADGKVFLALRRFRPECLLTSGGDSVLERLLDDCSLVVLQDADMRPQDLVAHRQRIRSPEVVAVDMTRSLGLKGHFSYALLRATDPGLESLMGERLW